MWMIHLDEEAPKVVPAPSVVMLDQGKRRLKCKLRGQDRHAGSFGFDTCMLTWDLAKWTGGPNREAVAP